jgi:Polyketide cyclase / dehydrase and lipid transport
MANTTVSKRYEIPAEELWAKIGDFQQLHVWHPAIANVEPGAEPALRLVTIAGPDRTQLVERCVEEGPLFHTYVFETEGSPMRNYRSTIRVREDGPGACIAEWEANFDADNDAEASLVENIRGFYQAGFDSV